MSGRMYTKSVTGGRLTGRREGKWGKRNFYFLFKILLNICLKKFYENAFMCSLYKK